VADSDMTCNELRPSCLNCTLDGLPISAVWHNCSFGNDVQFECQVKDAAIPCQVTP
jgi:hypothetical protein